MYILVKTLTAPGSAHLLGLKKAISQERLNAYANMTGEPLIDIAARYAWNVALAEALYPVLQSLEVALRNSIHAAVGAAPFTTNGAPVGEFWFREAAVLVSPTSRKLVAEAERDIAKEGKRITAGRVVAGLSFGFWVALLRRTYAENAATAHALSQARAAGNAPLQYPLWPSLIPKVFPHFQPQHGNPASGRRLLLARFEAIRVFRNRVMHHESIWRGRRDRNGNVVPLSDVYGEIAEALAWISPELHAMMSDPAFCRFLDVHRAGEAPFKARLASFP